MKENSLEIEECSGLPSAEARRILHEDGPNKLPSQKKKNTLLILLHVVSEPMLVLLLGSWVIYVVLGSMDDAMTLGLFVAFIIGITLYQERKTERTLERLKELAHPRALVVRDGKRKKIRGMGLVRGDVVIIQEGDRIPADGCLLSSTNLLVDESFLTGESLPVQKFLQRDLSKTNIAVNKHNPGVVYSGSMVIAGRGIMKITATGIRTEVGKISKSIQNIKDEDTLLHRETRKLVNYFTLIGGLVCVAFVVIYMSFVGGFLDGMLAGLTLGMSMLPEEFPVTLTIFLALGAWRISKSHVLARRPATIETLGAATVLCVDKTGTLTLNITKLSELYIPTVSEAVDVGAEAPVPEELKELLRIGFLASRRDSNDPIENEIIRRGELHLDEGESVHLSWKLVREYPFSSEGRSNSHVWKIKDSDKYVVAAKGTPEEILKLCRLPQLKQKKIIERIREMSDRGLRVLGVAKSIHTKEKFPNKQSEFEFEFVGLLGFSDPVRPQVAKSLAEAYGAGIRVIMVTGDYPGTAVAVAQKIGLRDHAEYLTGEDLEKMNHLELREKIRNINIFARVLPEQKLAIVNALKANGEIVAMTGDGINDAPSLKAAHIGIAMGERGTDVAREAASMVLMDDDFSSIVSAVRLGRRIFTNLKKAMGYIVAVHIPIAGMALFPISLGFPILFLPAHIAFLELIIDPACSTAFEAEVEERDIMKKSPRKLSQSILDKRTLLFSITQGLVVLFLVLGYFLLLSGTNRSILEIRSLTFIVFVLANLALIVTNLAGTYGLAKNSKWRNVALRMIVGGAIMALLLVFSITPIRSVFHFSLVGLVDLAWAILTGFLIWAILEFIKWKAKQV
ncbi:cation-translocating P-type ATPase [Patescibacteria group bacterium]|nr:MAG: cation-translocating P-type ATPase [Patescibacteria group bacterium]